jgi:hypothetical protein
MLDRVHRAFLGDSHALEALECARRDGTQDWVDGLAGHLVRHAARDRKLAAYMLDFRGLLDQGNEFQYTASRTQDVKTAGDAFAVGSREPAVRRNAEVSQPPGAEPVARWYRGGEYRSSLLFVAAVAGLGFGGVLIVSGVLTEGGAGAVVYGAVLVTLTLVGLWTTGRAGIGVTARYVLIRGMTGRTTRVPWEEVERFSVARVWGIPGARFRLRVITVIGPDGEWWYTLGCTTSTWTRASTERLLHALEGERPPRDSAAGSPPAPPGGAQAPGANSTLPPSSPQPSGARQPAARGWLPPWVAAALRTVQLIVGLVAVTAFLLIGITIIKGGLARYGQALQAGRGQGTVGFFVPTVTCDGGCDQDGEFRLPDGRVIARDIALNDEDTLDVQAGVPVPALDIGGTIYPLHDTSARADAGIRIFGGGALELLALVGGTGVIRTMRQRHNQAKEAYDVGRRWDSRLDS